jgi:3',5'-cyclic AMP phosphodiesterase CpdA
VKIVVTHHPFDLPEGVSGDHVVGRARLAMKTLAECRVDLLLAGHFHVGATGHTATRYRTENYSALIVSAGTSTWTRSTEFTERHSDRRRKDHDRTANLAPRAGRLRPSLDGTI